MTVLKKEDIFKEFGKSKKDTGSAESQVALFSKRIDHLSNHLKIMQRTSIQRNPWLRWLVKEETYSST